MTDDQDRQTQRPHDPNSQSKPEAQTPTSDTTGPAPERTGPGSGDQHGRPSDDSDPGHS